MQASFRFAEVHTPALLVLVLWAGLLAIPVHGAQLNVSYSQMATGSVVNLSQQGALDWVHWGLFTESSIDRKAGATPLISDFTTVDPSNGYTFVYQYADNWNGYTWNDGTPNTAVTNTMTGVWAYSPGPGGNVMFGSGFHFTVRATTNTQTLRVYVGAYGARGKFSASLSDNSAPAFTSTMNNSVFNTGNGPSGLYTINFSAGSATQLLNISYTLESAAGGHTFDANVTLQSAALTAPGANSIPYVLLASPPEGTSVVTPSNLLLTATASDNDGSITLIEFYDGTNKLGDVAPPASSFTWTNPPAGRHTLTARAIDNAAGVGVSLPAAVFVATNGGALTAARSAAPLTVDLTSEGSSDWAHWGLLNPSNFNHRATGGSQISNVTRLGTNAVFQYFDAATAVTWSDGSPVGSVVNTNVGIYVGGVTNGFQITAPADPTSRTLRVYCGLYGAQGSFQAWLSDFSGRAFTDTSLSNVYGNSAVVYTITYRAASPGQQLIVRYVAENLFDYDYGNVTLQAATLQGPAAPAPVKLVNPVLDGSAFRFSFTSALNAPYSAQFTPSLAPTNWQTFLNLTGTGGSLSVTDSVPAAQRFYRVITP